MTFREFIRTPGSVFWTYGFPLMMALALGFAFQTRKAPPLPVAIVESDFVAAQLDALQSNARLKPVMLEAAAAEDEFRRGKYLLVVSRRLGVLQVKIDETRPDSELAKLQVERSLQPRRGPQAPPIITVNETTPGWRYIDWLIPGLISLNLLGAGMWGVGFNLVQMRVKNILRRLMVTPMHKSEFMIAFLLSRLFLVIPEAVLIIGFGHFLFDVPIVGSLWTVLLLVILGAISFTGLGMLIASRARTIEVVSGLMNLTMLPMWLLGGCFFASDRFPQVVQDWVVRFLPISHLNNALRGVISEGAGVADILPELGFLGAFSVIAMALAIRCFRWT
jgi:ABC-2 type transport system permease protein